MTHTQPQGFLAVPPTGKGPGVLVLHASWGLNDTIKAFCTRLAESGFVAFAPDLYHGKVADNIPDAETLGKALDSNHLQAKAEIAEATRFLNESAGQADRGLAVIAFSLGAYYALHLADADPEHIRSVVIFYGTDGTVGGDYSNSRAAYLGHFAENDQFEPQSNVDNLGETLRRAGRPVTFYRYSGTGHWFFEPDRSAYNQAAASLAWDRTLAFLNAPPAEKLFMNITWKTIIWQQFGAAIDMLDNALRACPDELWRDRLWDHPSERPEYSQFWYLVYHALFWLDLYLTGAEEGFAPPSPFTLIEQDADGPLPERPYTKDELQAYLDYGRKKCQATIEALTDEAAQRRCPFGWGEVSFGELLLYNMRHVQEHAAQLNLRLGQKVGEAPDWVAKAKSRA